MKRSWIFFNFIYLFWIFFPRVSISTVLFDWFVYLCLKKSSKSEENGYLGQTFPVLAQKSHQHKETHFNAYGISNLLYCHPNLPLFISRKQIQKVKTYSFYLDVTFFSDFRKKPAKNCGVLRYIINPDDLRKL